MFGEPSLNIISPCDEKGTPMLRTSVGLKPKIPKESQLLYFGTEYFEQLRFHSKKVTIPKL